MNQSLKWLADLQDTAWSRIASAMREGLPVPNGFLALPRAPEVEIRAAYEELKIREKVHFVAVRGATHAVLNLLGPDQLIYAVRRFWSESPEAPILVQRMIHAMWCGKAEWHRKNLRVKANEGMLILDPDTYLLNGITGKCIRKSLESRQRKTIRHVDGAAKTVEREGERLPMSADHLKSIMDLAHRANADIGWAIDDLDKTWLLRIAR